MFADDQDYQQYLLELRRCRDEQPYRLLAYALMPNHAHLVVQAGPAPTVSRVMQRLESVYAKYFNARHGRVGHLTQGRFYSNHVDRDAYLLEVSRYVHLNPVRAHLARQAFDYPWSSYRVYVSHPSDPLELIDPGPVLEQFGSTRDVQRTRYRAFVDELAAEEARLAQWLSALKRRKLIPPDQWLSPPPRCQTPFEAGKVSDTF